MTTITLDNPPVVLYQGDDARVIALEIENFRILAAAGYFAGRTFRVVVEPGACRYCGTNGEHYCPADVAVD